MRKAAVAVFAMIAAFAVGIPAAQAGSPHFIRSATTATVSGSTLTVTGKEAGLGDESQVHLELTATAICVNNGGNHPKAANKTSVSTAGDFPVQNGKADFTLTATATFQPDCSQSMTVQYTNIVVTDTTNGISIAL
jgi:hypothetical protein